MNDTKLKLAITQGDINGVGCEVILKALSDNRVCELCTPIVYGSARALAFHKKNLTECEVSFNQIRSVEEAHGGRINLINCGDEFAKVDIGQSTENAGKAALAALDAAVADCKRGAIDLLVTAPINKKNIQSETFNFAGHTEYLAAQYDDNQPLMIMVSDIMRVGLVTIHRPLKEVEEAISEEAILNKLRLFKASLIQDFMLEQPKIAVLSLNPHSGDEGLLGDEESRIIKPAIVKAFEENIMAFGPFAADGFFGSGAFSKYDGVLAMYHDQGLIPFKALSVNMSVNYTAGLPLVRTSPAHGVAYDIAGQNRADAASLLSAIYLAIDVYRNRQIHKNITAHPLQKHRIENGPDISVSDLPTADNE